MSVTPRGWCKAPVEGSSHPLETVARFIARRISLLITVLILHVLSDFYNRLLVTPRASTDESNHCSLLLRGYAHSIAVQSKNFDEIAIGFVSELGRNVSENAWQRCV